MRCTVLTLLPLPKFAEPGVFRFGMVAGPPSFPVGAHSVFTLGSKDVLFSGSFSLGCHYGSLLSRDISPEANWYRTQIPTYLFRPEQNSAQPKLLAGACLLGSRTLCYSCLGSALLIDVSFPPNASRHQVPGAPERRTPVTERACCTPAVLTLLWPSPSFRFGFHRVSTSPRLAKLTSLRSLRRQQGSFLSLQLQSSIAALLIPALPAATRSPPVPSSHLQGPLPCLWPINPAFSSCI